MSGSRLPSLFSFAFLAAALVLAALLHNFTQELVGVLADLPLAVFGGRVGLG